MVNGVNPDSRSLQAETNGLSGKSCGVLDSVEAFLFGRGNQLAVEQNSR